MSGGIPGKAGHLLEAWSTLDHTDAQTMRADISVINKNDSRASSVLKIENIMFQSIGRSAASNRESKPWEKDVYSKIKWSLDMSLATPTHLLKVKKHLSHALDSRETQIIQDLRRVCICYINDAFKSLSISEDGSKPSSTSLPLGN